MKANRGRTKNIELAVAGTLIALIALLPVYSGTRTFPIAVVDGNSMYPNLQNGDLVFFRGVGPQQIANGTIIVFVEGDSGMPMLDSIIRPVVIHRVVGTLVQADGQLYYKTRGDNNQFTDPTLTQADHVLGVPVQVIPGVGELLLFVKSPQGMVAAVGIISLLYLATYDSKSREEKMKKTLLASFARLAINGQLRGEQYERMKLAVEYSDELSLESLRDPMAVSITDWLKNGALKRGWNEEEVACPDCRAPALQFNAAVGTHFLLCPSCVSGQAAAVRQIPSPQAVDPPITTPRAMAAPIPVANLQSLAPPVVNSASAGQSLETVTGSEPAEGKVDRASQKGDTLTRFGELLPEEWKAALKTREAERNKHSQKREAAGDRKEVSQLKVGEIPPSKKQVGDLVEREDKYYIVKAKRFDVFENKWKYTLVAA